MLIKKKKNGITHARECARAHIHAHKKDLLSKTLTENNLTFRDRNDTHSLKYYLWRKRLLKDQIWIVVEIVQIHWVQHSLQEQLIHVYLVHFVHIWYVEYSWRG